MPKSNKKEKSLIDSLDLEKGYKTLFESSVDAIMILEPPSWKFVIGNPAALKIFKAKNQAEFIKAGPADVSPKKQPNGRDSATEAKKQITRALKSGSASFEWKHMRLDGEEFWANVLLTSFKIDNKSFVQATVRDITAKKELERKVKEKEINYRDYVESAPYGIFIANKQGRYIDANSEAGSQLKYSKEELLKLSVSDIVAKESLPKTLEAFQKVLKEGRAEVEVLFLRKDKTTFEGTVRAIKLSNGHVIGFVQDVSELNAKIEELEKTNKLMVGRELKMIELKEKIKKLENQLKNK